MFLPHLTYVLDKSSDRVAKLLHALDQVEPALDAGEPGAETGNG
jgi:hypothetical protein